MSVVKMLAASSLLLSSTAWASDPLSFSLLSDEKYTEQAVAIADLSDGTYVKIGFAVSNVGPGDGKGACRLLIIEPDGAITSDSKIVDREAWSYDEATKKLKVGDCSASADGGLVFDANLDKGHVTLTLSSAPSRQSAGKVEIDGDFWELDTMVKWADAKVTIETGGKKRNLTGRGYADHPRSKIMPGKLAKRWFRFRGLTGSDPRLVMIRFPQSGAPVGWHDSKSGRVDLDRMMMAPEKGNNWKARFKSGKSEWRVTTSKLLVRDAPIEQQGKLLGSMLSAVVGNPVTYTYRGTLVERGTNKTIPGLIEVTITDE